MVLWKMKILIGVMIVLNHKYKYLCVPSLLTWIQQGGTLLGNCGRTATTFINFL